MDRFTAFLDQRRAKDALRLLVPIRARAGGRIALAEDSNERPLLDFASNDYLALSADPELKLAAGQALEEFGSGSGAARLMSGDLELFHRLEEAIARLKKTEAALVFGSGYLANVGVIPALVGRGDTIFADRLCHASIIDGSILAGAHLSRFYHNDLNHLERLLVRGHKGRGQILVVVESLYSMDGDIAPLAELVRMKEKHGFLLMVDEAHATGVFGAGGGGLLEESGTAAGVDVAMGTLGKALGSYGAFVAAKRHIVDYLTNRARSFVFSTALPPAAAAAALAAVGLVRTRPLGMELKKNVRFFKNLLQEGGLAQDLGATQIVPLMVGSSAHALALAAQLNRRGVFAPAIRPPTVPENTARIRLSVTRHLDREALAQAAQLIIDEYGRLFSGMP